MRRGTGRANRMFASCCCRNYWESLFYSPLLPMSNLPQIKGMLLEEVILHLLRFSGYEPVMSHDHGRTTKKVGAGLAVIGRGGDHQIDAIADYSPTPPFGHPLRLLVEAKCWKDKVKLPEIRNAVGVLKDLNERWKGRSAAGGRHHYQYAYFSASDYTIDAIRYAFAQDIYLIPLAKSAYLTAVVECIKSLKDSDFPDRAKKGYVGTLRSQVRAKLYGNGNEVIPAALNPVFEASATLAFGLIAVLRGGIVLFLAANSDAIMRLSPAYSYSRWPDPLISFDLTPEMRMQLHNEMMQLFLEGGAIHEWMRSFYSVFRRCTDDYFQDDNAPEYFWLLRRYESYYERLFSDPKLLSNEGTRNTWIWFNLLPSNWKVRIRYTNRSNWYIQQVSESDDQVINLFSFDLPETLFRKYRRRAADVPQEQAFDLKRQAFSAFHSFLQCGTHRRILEFKLDQDWLTALEQEFAEI